MKEITIYTDGSSRGNPGPGGWGAVVITEDKVWEMGGRDQMTTNNKMELTAAIEALKALDGQESITIYSDSEYVIKGITLWIHGWQKKNWKNSQKKAVLNQELWEKLLEVTENKEISWKHVRGHADTPGNERCDEIATRYADGEKMSLYNGPKSNYPFQNILKI